MNVSSSFNKHMLKKIAAETVGKDVAAKLWKRIEIIGDLVVIRKPFDIEIHILKPIAERLLEIMPYIRSVWVAISPVKGAERIREYVHLAGEARSETIYKEHGCRFKLDIRKVYISPVLGYDHIRTARLVRRDEIIANFFAGIGGYSIIISKYVNPVYVISIDLNSVAVRYLKENVELNKVEAFNEVIHGDALILARSFRNIDRALLPCPELSLEAFKELLRAPVLKRGAYVHAHEFVNAGNKREAVTKAFSNYVRVAENYGVKLALSGHHVIRSVGPRRYHVVLDIKVLNS
ncbi:MAG: class I SAM-dependent methyltransferase family protein [Thermoprotei archaeon]|nr:MAG: class I SAM-dependent methyltransferase family protein [Thermoprotei archaeon]